MVGVQRRRRSSDQDGAGHRLLQLRGLLEDIFERRAHTRMLSNQITDACL